MPIQSSTLRRYYRELRRASDRREARSEINIRRIYKQILRETDAIIAAEYRKFAVDDRLDYGALQRANQYARFLEEVAEGLSTATRKVSRELLAVVQDVYTLNYDGVVSAVHTLTREELREALQSVRNARPEVIRAAVQNPVSGLTLSDTLERNRANIIYDIKRQINAGLSNGDRYSTMARRIQKSLDEDYRKALRIARTETHRVRESGLNDVANDIQEAIDEGDSGIVMVKTWINMDDSRVRTDHIEMQGQIRKTDDDFDLPDGSTAMSPGNSGVAKQDINCRCYASYDLLTREEAEREGL